MRLFGDTNIDFMKMRYPNYIISCLIIVVGLVFAFASGGLKYTIDFTGGLSMELDLSPTNANVAPLTIHDIRTTLTNNGIEDLEIQELQAPDKTKKYYNIQMKGTENDVNQVAAKIESVLRSTYPNNTNEDIIRNKEVVGPKAGLDLRGKAIKAILLSCLFIGLYIWVRYRFVWGIAAAASLIHDTLIIIAFLAIFKVPVGMTVLAALLTLVGYSINDTVVVFDRIRENLKLYRKDDYTTIFNRSINETLSRTIITSLTVFITDLALLLFGGTVIHDFALVFLIGIITGTYSSIFIASAIVLDYNLIHQKKDPKGAKLH